jgi:hypothetical protein
MKGAIRAAFVRATHEEGQTREALDNIIVYRTYLNPLLSISVLS